ncbi:MAG: TetR/AcrR family transcriptional regulator [Paracoccus sp. (in: a-proteobacteria)]|nr:TetR/AcrR family transcriptional regulator [Paracoccus sp. (in: a-proteobacteria)]
MDINQTVNRGRKFAQVLDGARRVFMRDGFEGASVDMIAREAGVSKATLYSYFPDKRLMFKEVFRDELMRERADATALVPVEMPMVQAMPLIARLLVSHLLSDFGLRTYRLCMAEAERFPSLSREFYERGIADLTRAIAGYLEIYLERGELRADVKDVSLAAYTFVHLVATRIQDHALFLGRDSVDDEMTQQSCDNAVMVFLRAYGAPGHNEPQ